MAFVHEIDDVNNVCLYLMNKMRGKSHSYKVTCHFLSFIFLTDFTGSQIKNRETLSNRLDHLKSHVT